MMTKAHTKHERLKHVTNDSRLDLSFIIVSDTCRSHRPLFCHLHNNNMLWHVQNFRLETPVVYRQMHTKGETETDF